MNGHRASRPRARSATRGFSLVWALVLLVMVGGVASASLSRLKAMRGDEVVDEADVAAVLAADGAVATARARLARDPAFAGGTVRVGPIDVATTVVRDAVGWVVTARAGGVASVEAGLVPDAGRPPRVTAWRRVR